MAVPIINEEYNSSGIDPITWNAIYGQLESQDSLDSLAIHEYIYLTTNPPISIYGSDDEYTQVYAPYGGSMQYITRESTTKAKIEVGIDYMDYDNSYYYVLSQQEINVSDVLLMIWGYIPYVGTLASMISNAQAVINSAAATSIKNAGGYAQIVTEAHSDGTTSSVVGWSRYPYMYLDDLSAYDIRTQTLSEKHDPWP